MPGLLKIVLKETFHFGIKGELKDILIESTIKPSHDEKFIGIPTNLAISGSWLAMNECVAKPFCKYGSPAWLFSFQALERDRENHKQIFPYERIKTDLCSLY